MNDPSTKPAPLQPRKPIGTTIKRKIRHSITLLKILIRNPGKTLLFFVGLAAFIEFIKVSCHAVQDVGYLFGWIIGASKSEISAVVAPLVFGLLGTAIFASFGRLISPGEKLVEAVCNGGTFKQAAASFVFKFALVFWLLVLTGHFVEHARRGIHFGSAVKNAPLKP